MRYKAEFQAEWERTFEATDDDAAKAKAFALGAPSTLVTLWRAEDEVDADPCYDYVASGEISKGWI